MNLYKHQLYLLEQHSESFKIWSAIIRIKAERKSLILKSSFGSTFIIMDLPSVLILVNTEMILCDVLTNTTDVYVDSYVNFTFCF